MFGRAWPALGAADRQSRWGAPWPSSSAASAVGSNLMRHVQIKEPESGFLLTLARAGPGTTTSDSSDPAMGKGQP